MTPSGIQVTSLRDHGIEHHDLYTPHVHDDFLIIWFRRGGGMHMVDFCEYAIPDNSFFLIAPGQVHAFCPGCSLEGAMLTVTAEFVHGEPGAENLFLKYRVHRAGVPYYVVSNEETLTTLWNMLEAIRLEIELYSSELMHRVMVKLHANAFAILLCRECLEKEKFAVSGTLRPAERLYILFRRELAVHYADMHSVREYAELLNVSSKTLTKAVSETVGKAPGQLIDEQIIIHAKRMLSCTPMMIKEVSDALGFADVANFGKFFRKNTGLLPKEFRASVR